MTQAVTESKVTGIEGPTVSRKSTPEYITGRRAYFKYREMVLAMPVGASSEFRL